jgi:methionine synthase I (cobalamin-dependent)
MTLATFPPEARVRPARPTYTRAQALPALLRQRIVLLDGAMGTMLQQRKLDEAAFRGSRFADHPTPLKGHNELLNLTQPQVVREIHETCLAAGSDIIETNTFGATAIAQADYDLGLNCAMGPALMRPYVAELARVADDTFISCYPNAGLPNPMSETGFDETPDVTSRLLGEFARDGLVNLVGGCCGTTPEHIAAIAQSVASARPRPLRESPTTPHPKSFRLGA